MRKNTALTPVKSEVFGFLGLCGYFSVRFLARVRVAQCSVCSVDFVEKLWESLWENLWESCGKNCGKILDKKISTVSTGILHRMGILVEKFPLGFAQRLTGSGGGFAQFPQSLLLQLLIR